MDSAEMQSVAHGSSCMRVATHWTFGRRYDIVFAGDYNCYPDERLAEWFPVPENRPHSVMRCVACFRYDKCGRVLVRQRTRVWQLHCMRQ